VALILKGMVDSANEREESRRPEQKERNRPKSIASLAFEHEPPC
jgi:hypothetical protein